VQQSLLACVDCTSVVACYKCTTIELQLNTVCSSPNKQGFEGIRHYCIKLQLNTVCSSISRVTSMAALLLHATSSIMGAAHNGPAVCAHHKNVVLLQGSKLHNSSLQASRLTAFSKFKCMTASGSISANSSVILATSNLHAGHNSQV
jgi:hypothetical protein